MPTPPPFEPPAEPPAGSPPEPLPELVRQWIAGWTVSRGAADPVAEPWGWTIDVGLVGHVSRHVLPAPTDQEVHKIAAATSAPGTWLKLFAPDETVRPWLGPEWELSPPGYLMAVPLDPAQPPPVPDGYTLTSWTRGGVIRVLVRTANGELAARGQLGLAGRTGVPDQILTSAEHRRRGLGALVMRTLQQEAHLAGARLGVLVGSAEGRALYTSLGWRTHAQMASLCYQPQ
jgi:GNAT superfamily N-acetyltransferase